MFSHASVHPSIHPHLSVHTRMEESYPGQVHGGVPQPGPAPPRVPPHRTWLGGTPMEGYPTSGTPRTDLAGGTPIGVPHWSDLAGGYHDGCTPLWLPHISLARGYPTSGTPPSDLARGTLMEGVPHLGYSPVRPGRGVPHLGPLTGGGYPNSYRITDGVLDTPRSVCLLRSRRRLFCYKQIAAPVLTNCNSSAFISIVTV